MTLKEAIALVNASGTHVVVPVEPTGEQVARAVRLASNEPPTTVDKELAALACLLMSWDRNIRNEGEMVVAVAEMIRDYRALLSASLTHSEGDR